MIDVSVNDCCGTQRTTAGARWERPVHAVSGTHVELDDADAALISQTSQLGMKSGVGRDSFIDSMLDAIDNFYRDAIQDLKAWSAAPPKLREPLEQLPTGTSLDSNALSSQDDPSVAPVTGGDSATSATSSTSSLGLRFRPLLLRGP